MQGTPKLFTHPLAAIEIPKCHPPTAMSSPLVQQAMHYEVLTPTTEQVMSCHALPCAAMHCHVLPCTRSTRPWHCTHDHPPMCISVEFPVPAIDLCSVHCLQCLAARPSIPHVIPHAWVLGIALVPTLERRQHACLGAHVCVLEASGVPWPALAKVWSRLPTHERPPL